MTSKKHAFNQLMHDLLINLNLLSDFVTNLLGDDLNRAQQTVHHVG